ncbi:MAG: type II toxin-antitoxin system RelE/ParE family toxin [Akkermansia sp.]
MLEIRQTHSFEKAYKRLHANQRADANAAIDQIINDPLIGVQKKGDLRSIRVHKFKMQRQLTLLAYSTKTRFSFSPSLP